MARIKNIEAFCNFCGSVTKMELAGEVTSGGEESNRWAKCKKCKQTMMINLEEALNLKKPSLEGIENSEVTEYTPQKTYSIGEAIYHKNWDDFGKVIAKEVLSNGRSSIAVEFQKSGSKKLIETL